MNQQHASAAKTSMSIQANHAAVWAKVGFYEHVGKQPNWLLRVSLPTPQEVDGRHGAVGDTCRCKYSDGGFLTKRITGVVEGSRVDFEIIEQSIRYQDSIKLLGGFIEVEEVDDESSLIHMVTFYENRVGMAPVSSFFINQVIKTMHRFVIDDMRERLETRLVRRPDSVVEQQHI